MKERGLLFVMILFFLLFNMSFAGEVIIITSPGMISLPEGGACKIAEVNTSAKIQGVLTKYGVESIKKAFEGDTTTFPFDVNNIFLATLPKSTDVREVVAELNALSEVDFSKLGLDTLDLDLDTLTFDSLAQNTWIHAEPNIMEVERATPNDSLFDKQWGLSNYPKGIKAINAWDISKGVSWVKIGVVDHGVDINHPDLKGRLTGDMPTWSSHGTKVAGVAGAVTNNGRGVAGVDWLSSVQSFNADPGGEANFAAAITRAANSGMHAINVSLAVGNVTTDNLWWMRSAVADAYKKGVFIAAAMGNDNIPEVMAPTALWPWAVTAVGASNWSGSKSYFSNYGWCIDIIAPGGTTTGGGAYDILTTAIEFPSDTLPPGDDTLYPPAKVLAPLGDWTQTYKFVSGCSFATPHVAGVAGLLKAYRPTLTTDDIQNILQLSARDIPPAGWDDHTGWGVLNADSALKMLGPPYAFIQGQTTTSPYVTWTSGVTKTFLYGVDGLAPDVYYLRIREVRQVVYFPRPFMSIPHIWARSANTDGYLPESITFGIRYAWVTQVTTDWVEMATYNMEVTTLDGENTYYLPKPVSDVRLAYSAQGEMALYAPSPCPSAEVIRLPEQNNINIVWGDNNFCESGYKIQKQDSLGNWYDFAVTGENSHFFVDSTLAGSDRAVYRVKAFNQYRESPLSPSVEVWNAPNTPSKVSIGLTQRPKNWDLLGEPGNDGSGGTTKDVSNQGNMPITSLDKKAPVKPPEPMVTTNEAVIVWKTPLNQKMRITGYRVFWTYYMWSGVPGFGSDVVGYSPLLPADSFVYVIYPLPYGCNHLLVGYVQIYVYAFSENGDSSALVGDWITPGNYDAHPGPPDMLENMDKSTVIPTVFALSQNYPNPFNITTTINYALPVDAQVKLVIYNVLGQRVRKLVDGPETAGNKTVIWDGRNDEGREVSSGIYFYCIQAGSFRETKKMSLLK